MDSSQTLPLHWKMTPRFAEWMHCIVLQPHYPRLHIRKSLYQASTPTYQEQMTGRTEAANVSLMLATREALLQPTISSRWLEPTIWGFCRWVLLGECCPHDGLSPKEQISAKHTSPCQDILPFSSSHDNFKSLYNTLAKTLPVWLFWTHSTTSTFPNIESDTSTRIFIRQHQHKVLITPKKRGEVR
jgi:hypothetical protein